MNALLIPSSGKIDIFDLTIKPKTKIKLKTIRQKIGLVFQFPEYQLFEDTVLKDISFGPKNFGKTKEEALSLARVAARDAGVEESLLEKSPFNLSGGQMRRVAIAGILASNPDVLILDEPTVGLDPVGKENLMMLLTDIREKTNKTIIMITHDMNNVARFATRVIVLSHGDIVFDGTPKALFNDFSILEKYNLGLPECAKYAHALKEKGLISYNEIPITKEELLDIIKEASHE